MEVKRFEWIYFEGTYIRVLEAKDYRLRGVDYSQFNHALNKFRQVNLSPFDDYRIASRQEVKEWLKEKDKEVADKAREHLRLAQNFGTIRKKYLLLKV